MSETRLILSAPPTPNAIDRSPAWIVITPQPERREVWSEVPHASILQRRRKRGGTARAAEPFATDLPNVRSTRAVHAAVADTISAFELLSTARKLIDLAAEIQTPELAVSVHGFAAALETRIAEAIISAALARSAEMPSYKREEPRPWRLARIRLLGVPASPRFARSFAEAHGNALARQLAVLPPNELTPGSYRQRLAALAKQRGWEFDFLDIAALKRRGAGAFLAVVQGSATNDAGIARLSHRPRRGRARERIALVGKGICFDTGGVNVKPNRYMLGMHQDMAGSAVALGTLLALAELECEFAIDCWLALAMNQIGPDAYKPNDVVTALDGTTIEVIHTDAEGRMVLADTLVLASRNRPALIIDYATLTGACIHSLGKSYSGIFTNRDPWLARLIEAGRASGERVWPFPQDADYDKALDSSVADVRQCAPEGEADHILAARFLSRFVKHDVPWIHLDLAAGNRKGGLAHIPTDETGFGVRYTCNLLLDQKILEFA